MVVLLDGELVHVAVHRPAGTWRVGRTTLDPDAGFDTDDIGTEKDCLTVARSHGPLANGEPYEPTAVEVRDREHGPANS